MARFNPDGEWSPIVAVGIASPRVDFLKGVRNLCGFDSSMLADGSAKDVSSSERVLEEVEQLPSPPAHAASNGKVGNIADRVQQVSKPALEFLEESPTFAGIISLFEPSAKESEEPSEFDK
jgi:hypothetical protein